MEIHNDALADICWTPNFHNEVRHTPPNSRGSAISQSTTVRIVGECDATVLAKSVVSRSGSNVFSQTREITKAKREQLAMLAGATSHKKVALDCLC